MRNWSFSPTHKSISNIECHIRGGERAAAGNDLRAGQAAAWRSGMSYMARVAYVVGVTEIPAAVAAELARLRAENARLLKMLELSPRQAAPPGPAQAGFFDAPPGPVHKD